MAGTEKDNAKLLKAVYDKFSLGDAERMRADLTDNATMMVAPMNQTLKGPSAIIDYFRNYQKAFGATIETKRVTACGDLVVSEFVGHGKHTGVFSTPMGNIQPTNRNINIPVCHIVQWKDGKIIDIHEYFDVTTLMNQLGVSMTQEQHPYPAS
jgi:ketosteroid isomerase-like protein